MILGIESSCDETAFALVDDQPQLLGHTLYSQIALHAQYGGVVPELASRDHVRKLIPLLHALLEQTGATLSQIQAIAYTAGPGLMGTLLVGAAFAQSLAWALRVPRLGVHHMEAHLLACMLEPEKPRFPFVALLVSGGHTLLVRVDGLGQYTLLGQSIDDAAGEAFDKTAKLLGLPYPGGAHLARLAEGGQAGRFKFSRPLTQRPGCDFSFSGLKTQVLTTWQKQEVQDEQTRADIALAFEDALIDTLLIKSRRALQQTGLTQLVIAGGVGANRKLRHEMRTQLPEVEVFYPRPEFCTDNAAMIAYTGALRWQRGEHDLSAPQLKPRWSLESLS